MARGSHAHLGGAVAEPMKSSPWAASTVKLAEQIQGSPWAASTVKLAEQIQGSPWATSTLRLAEVAGTSVWAGAAAQLAESMKTPEWAESAAQLAESMKAPEWAESATRLIEFASTSAWADAASSLRAILEDRSLRESFVAAVDIEPSRTNRADSGEEDKAAKPSPRDSKRGISFTTAIYLAAALALHLTNFATTRDPVFDPHQFLVDEFVAMGLALTFYCTFWKD
jgi:hypothetical protein